MSEERSSDEAGNEGPALKAPTIRRASAADAAQVAAVHVASWRESYAGIVPEAYLAGLSVAKRTALWTSVIAAASDEADLPWVAVNSGGEVVGFTSSGPSRSPEFSGAGEVYAIYLRNAWQGRGIGRALFQRARSDLAASFERMMLWVLKDNPTLGFYLKQGGVQTSEKTEEIGGLALIECALAWDLRAEARSLRRQTPFWVKVK